MSHDALYVGTAMVDITPPPGIPMGGYWGRRSGAEGVHDPLGSRALTFRRGSAVAALIAVDLVGLDARWVGQLRTRIDAASHRLAGENVMVCCSHTHAGPLTLPYWGMGEIDTEYMANLQDKLVEVVLQAESSEQPVSLAYARVSAQLGVNRRQQTRKGTVIGTNPDGPVADYAHVVRFGTSDKVLAVLFSHACHGVVMGSENHWISAEWPGAATRYIERSTGSTAVFVNGACGDINPRLTHAGFAQVEELGSELGAAVVQGVSDATPLEAATVCCAHAVIELPLCPPPSRLRAEAAARMARWRLAVGRRWHQDMDRPALRVLEARASWAEDRLAWQRAGADRNRWMPFEIQALRVGDVILLGMEGEIFVRYQLELEQAQRPVMVCGYANGCTGYIPAAEAYRSGGYEVDQAYKVYPSVQRIAPGSERLILQTARQLLAEV